MAVNLQPGGRGRTIMSCISCSIITFSSKATIQSSFIAYIIHNLTILAGVHLMIHRVDCLAKKIISTLLIDMLNHDPYSHPSSSSPLVSLTCTILLDFSKYHHRHHEHTLPPCPLKWKKKLQDSCMSYQYNIWSIQKLTNHWDVHHEQAIAWLQSCFAWLG